MFENYNIWRKINFKKEPSHQLTVKKLCVPCFGDLSQDMLTDTTSPTTLVSLV